MIKSSFPEISDDEIVRTLNAITSDHSIWRSSLLKKLSAGTYEHKHLAFLFQQHHHYSSNFTKLLCLAASRMNETKHRAIIIENLYEEAGEENVEKRHSELMSDFLRSMGIEPNTNIKSYTALYVERCITFLTHCDAIEAAAFLAWGTEGIVPKLYGYFISALKATGVTEEEYRYFSLHIECDDGHHEALMQVALDIYNNCSDQMEKAALYQKMSKAVKKSLDMRDVYFDEIYSYLEKLSTKSIYQNIKEECFQKAKSDSNTVQHFAGGSKNLNSNSNVDKDKNINFHEERTPLSPQIIDPVILKIAPYSKNEPRKHSHESIFYVLSGKGTVHTEEKNTTIETGSMAYIPRWIDHHIQNTGDEVLTILAVTDSGLTQQLNNIPEVSYHQHSKNLSEESLAV